MADTPKTALVFGASGISGWAMMNNLVSYPTPTTFSRIIGLTNRPLSLAESGLPQDSRMEMYHGVNLRLTQPEVRELLQKTIPRLNEITHVYYLAYSNATEYAKDVMDLKELNIHMTTQAVRAVDALCSNMKMFVLQTGTNNYGVACFDHIKSINLSPPLLESAPRVPSPYGDSIFYYAQQDIIASIQVGKSWSWVDVRPDVIIGLVPHASIMTVSEPMALYLSLFRFVNGPDASVPFPGTEAVYKHHFTDSSQDIIARSEIFASLQPGEVVNGQSYNTADNAVPISFETKWPMLCSWFGLQGVPPTETSGGEPWVDSWWRDHEADYAAMREKYGLKEGAPTQASWNYFSCLTKMLDKSRFLSLEKIRKLGFKEERGHEEGYYAAFERMAAKGVIPKRGAIEIRGS